MVTSLLDTDGSPAHSEGDEPDGPGKNGPGDRMRRRALFPRDHALTFAGLLVTVSGFVVLLVTWGKVAGLALVARQTPYILSGGFTGLGLVVVGAAATVVGTWQAEVKASRREVGRVAAVVRELAECLRAGAPE